MNEIIKNQQEQAYLEIRKKIMKLIYYPGQKISEKLIGEDIHVGRTPVREALIRLKREGLIQIYPQSGTYISKIALDSAFHARYVREHIEQSIMIESTTKITKAVRDHLKKLIEQQIYFFHKQNIELFFEKDEEFHRFFYEITNKLDIWVWLQLFNAHLNRFRWLSLKVKELQWNKIINQHQNIAKAVMGGKTDEAQFLTTQHLHLMIDEQQVLVNKFPDYFIDVDQPKNDE